MIPTPLSALDEKRFGIRSARGVIAGQEDISAVLGYCREQGVKFLIVRCDTREIAIAQELERQGFLLMDALVYYRRMLENLPPLPTDLTMDYAIRHNLRLEARFCDQEMAFLLWNGHDWKHIYRSNRANLGFMPYQSA